MASNHAVCFLTYHSFSFLLDDFQLCRLLFISHIQSETIYDNFTTSDKSNWLLFYHRSPFFCQAFVVYFCIAFVVYFCTAFVVYFCTTFVVYFCIAFDVYFCTAFVVYFCISFVVYFHCLFLYSFRLPVSKFHHTILSLSFNHPSFNSLYLTNQSNQPIKRSQYKTITLCYL